jgi:hypothetical protein
MGAAVAVFGILLMAGGWILVRLIGEVYPAAATRRCADCSYDMTGTPGLRCPECGSQARAEGDLHRRAEYAPRDQARLLGQAGGILAVVVGLMLIWGGAWLAVGPG